MLFKGKPLHPILRWATDFPVGKRVLYSPAIHWLSQFPTRLFLCLAVLYSLITSTYLVLSHQVLPWSTNPATLASAFTHAWRHYDAFFFLSIAQGGYTDPLSPAFFPLYPLLIHLVAYPLGGHLTAAAMLVSWLCSWGCFHWFYQLAMREYGEQVARWTLLFFALWPFSFFSFAPYSEAVFLLVSIGAVERARAGHMWQASILGGLGMLARPTGILLLIPLAWEWHRRHPHFHKKIRSLLTAWPLTIIPCALLTFMVYLWGVIHNPLAFVQAESLVWNRHLTPPWETLGFFGNAFQLATTRGTPQVFLANLLDLFPVILLPVVVLYYTLVYRRLWLGAALYQLAISMLIFAEPTHPSPEFYYRVLLGAPRFLLPAFPIYLLLGQFGVARPRLARVVLACSAMLWFLFTFRSFSGFFIA